MVFKSKSKKKAVKKAEPKKAAFKKTAKKSGPMNGVKDRTDYLTTYSCHKCGVVVTEGPSPMYLKAVCCKCKVRMSVTFKKAGD